MLSFTSIPWLWIAATMAIVLVGSGSGRAAPRGLTMTEDLVVTINGQTLSYKKEAERPLGAEKFVKLGTPGPNEDRFLFSIPRRKVVNEFDLTGLAWKSTAGCDGIPSYKEGEVSGIVTVSLQSGKPVTPTIVLTAG